MKKNLVLPNDFWGSHIRKVMEQAQEMATNDQNCEFEFNGRLIIVSKVTNLDLLERDFSNSYLMEWKTIGPDCAENYPLKTLSDMAAKRSQKEERERKQREEWDRKDKEQRELFESKVAGIEMEVSNQEQWNDCVEKNSDPYGKCAVDYARDWARLMQYELSNGKSLVEIAESTSHELGFYGITGFMYGCAVQMLSACWKHGEELRKWHNKEYNHEGEGVVNPALLNVNLN